ncbi:hypothetical protein Y032_0087g2053 [Ancylostoma ceylanicum]|uniref:Uncharacterized protein n=1 Tax=Ancylostoma ceylanicum TaxID=53326 RepID=A0A016TPZ8_9BILA|nr:hypothetical protein Y032_0087g2053 [Ancylostoma ceylanicum]
MTTHLAEYLVWQEIWRSSYRKFKTVPYLVVLCTPSWIFALFFTIYGWVMIDNEILQFCNVIFSKFRLSLRLLQRLGIDEQVTVREV